MQTKVEMFAELLQPIVIKINEICEQHDVPMLMAFCLDYIEK
jgi:hypothetical protein